MKKYVTYVALFSMLLVAACNSNDSVEQAAEQSVAQFEQAGVKNMKNDALFVAEAASANMLQLQLSEQAISRGVSPEVKEMAQQMEQAHRQMMEELQSLATQTNIVLPQTLGNSHKDIYDDVTAKDGISFDLAYIREMEKQHDKLLDRYEDMAKSGVSMEVKQYASRQIPLIRQHLQRAQTLEDKIK